MKEFMKYIVNKNSIITANPGGGSTSLALLLTNMLSKYYSVLFFDTGHMIDRSYIERHYNDMYNNCFIMQSSLDYFIDYLSEMNRHLSNLDYIVIDTADILDKKKIQFLFDIFDVCNVNVICTSQLRVNMGTGKPYSTVEEWNKQLASKPFDNSIWIRKVNEPNTFLNRKYIDIHNHFRRGNDFITRKIMNFDKKQGNIT